MSDSHQILYCHCAFAGILSARARASALRQLWDAKLPFMAVPDMCELAARKDLYLQECVKSSSLQIASCFPRAVKWMFDDAQAPLTEAKTQFLNLRTEAAEGTIDFQWGRGVEAIQSVSGPVTVPWVGLDWGNAPSPQPSPPAGARESESPTQPSPVQRAGEPEAELGDSRLELIQGLLAAGIAVSVGPNFVGSSHSGAIAVLGMMPAAAPNVGGNSNFVSIAGLDVATVVAKVKALCAEKGIARPPAWQPWYPVIDHDRCTQCMQCLSFCLFGVFGVDAEHRLQTQNPENCKTSCPACSRVCPEAAIIFAKYPNGPINGDRVEAAEVQREKVKVDISALLGGDVYSILRSRNERSRSRFSKERDPDQALMERQRCLAQLAGEIPPEVLKSLPSPEEMRQRAGEAQARAKAALRKEPI